MRHKSLLAYAAGLAAWLTASAAWSATPVATAFTYQGQLKDSGVPADGLYDLDFQLYDSRTGGIAIDQSVLKEEVEVTNGLFTVILDFNSGTFAGEDRWLEISMRRSISGTPFVVLSPRQLLTAAPYALYALDAPGSGDGFWAANGNDIYNTNSGRVGIGTSAPSYPLHLFGTAQIMTKIVTSHTIGTWFDLENTSTGGKRWGLVSTGSGNGEGAGHLLLRAISDGRTVMTLQGTGNVGIGTTAPQARLHLAGGPDLEPESGGFLVMGSITGANLAFDDNELMARNNGAASTMYLNADGGKVQVGSSSWTQPSLAVYGGGQGKMNAPLQVINIEGNQGMATWLLNGSNFATAHVENAGSGEVLWLERATTTGPFIVAYNKQTETRPFQVDANGRTTVTVLQITGGADLSEQFRVAEVKQKPTPGSVVSIDPQHPGDLIVSSRAYDRTVAGVISGAGGVQPGMLMGQADSIADGEHPVALTGRVWCQCTAANGPIEPGDLLTTSDVPGCAMKITDYDRAHGATIGKAMTGLEQGQGLVLVLVSLQ